MAAPIGRAIRNWRRFASNTARSEVAAVLAMMVIVAVATSVLAFAMDHPVPASGKAPANPCAAAAGSASARAEGPQVVVADASTDNGTVAVFTDRADDAAERQSTQLAVEDGSLKPDECLGTSVSDLVRSDGESIPDSQVSSWAESDNTGTRVTVYIEVSPRYGTVTAPGGYTGNVYLDDVRATGGNVPVDIHVTQYVTLATLAGGGALATTPTLRALVDRVVIPLVRKSGSPSDAAPEVPGIPAVAVIPAILAGSPASTPAGGDGGSLPAPPVLPAPRDPMEM